MKYCDFNGCSNKIKSGYYCSDHKRSKKSARSKRKKKEIYQHDNKQFYNSKAWKSTREYVYERDRGLCQRCGMFVFGRRAHVHHVIPIKIDSTLRLDPNNLKLLCRDCHFIEENEERKEKVFPSYFG
ncbi:HNH endonuclease [Halomonas phage YPHTV-1]|nr:HNH endonuclease [Halomonas phage YPHTV-1]